MNAIQVGPAIIQQSWIVIGSGLVVGYLLLTFSSPFKGEGGKEIRETIGNSVITFILTFLFGTFIFQIDMVIRDPIAVMSYPSGEQELYLATIFTITYLMYSSIKNKVGPFEYVHGLLYYLLPTSFIFEFWVQRNGREMWDGISVILPWDNHPISLYMLVFSAILLIILLKIESVKVEQKVINILLIWTITLNLTALLDDYPVYFGIPVTQWFYLFLLSIVLGLVVINQIKKKGFYKW
ncbi:hypothetical protein [Litchfieldia alkalitelluris]|nr:hypothetical protein [Litchfieldia alkalitelluris]